MYKSIHTYLLKVASVILTVYFMVCSGTTDAPTYANASYTAFSNEAISALQGPEELALNFSLPIHPVKAIKPEVIVTHVSERTRILFHLLSLGVLYFVFRNKSHQFLTFRNYCKSFSVSIPIFIFCRKLII